MPYKDKEAQREYTRNWLANRRTDFFSDKKCVNCGSTECLELDHIDPEKKLSHKIWSWSEERRAAEIAKCQILCATCHKEKTRTWQMSRRSHGRTMYAHGCKCKVCVEAKRLHNAQRYASKA